MTLLSHLDCRAASGEHPERHLAGYAGILQADAYAGFNTVYKSERRPGPIIEAACWAHARRKFFELAAIASKARGKTAVISPIAFEAVQTIDAVFMLERAINGLSPPERLAARRTDIAPVVKDLVDWMRQERAKLSRHNDVAKAMDYMLKRIDAFKRFLDDGRICLSNNAAERALRGIALGRKSWLFAGSDRGAERAAVMLTLIQTAQAQRRRSPGLACRCTGAHQRSRHPQARSAAALELEDRARQTGGMMSPIRPNTASDSFNEIATVRIELRHTDPLIWRQVEVPTSITLKVLHDIIQAVIGWFDYHFWEFTIGKQRYGLPMDDDWGAKPCTAAAKVRLRDVLKQRKTIIDYTYDFGDCWEHRLTVTGVRAGQPGVPYPRYINGERNGPPEDCGGIPGFYELLRALADPAHPDHAHLKEWAGDYDPATFDPLPIKYALGRIANRRNAAKVRLAKKKHVR